MISPFNSLRGIGVLLRDLAEQTVSLARGEVTLAKLEVGDAARGIGKSAVYLALGAVLLLLGALALVAALVMLIGSQWLPGDRYWLAALIGFLLTAALAAFFAKRGMSFVSPSGLKPDETMATLKEDSEWVKRRLTSAGTSS